MYHFFATKWKILEINVTYYEKNNITYELFLYHYRTHEIRFLKLIQRSERWLMDGLFIPI
jgi:hypothetical protein